MCVVRGFTFRLLLRSLFVNGRRRRCCCRCFSCSRFFRFRKRRLLEISIGVDEVLVSIGDQSFVHIRSFANDGAQSRHRRLNLFCVRACVLVVNFAKISTEEINRCRWSSAITFENRSGLPSLRVLFAFTSSASVLSIVLSRSKIYQSFCRSSNDFKRNSETRQARPSNYGRFSTTTAKNKRYRLIKNLTQNAIVKKFRLTRTNTHRSAERIFASDVEKL